MAITYQICGECKTPIFKGYIGRQTNINYCRCDKPSTPLEEIDALLKKIDALEDRINNLIAENQVQKTNLLKK